MFPTFPCILSRFIKNTGFGSEVITLDTFSWYSHFEFGTPDRTWIGAHIKGGIQERPWDYCDPLREVHYAIPLASKAEEDAWLKTIRADIGTHYNVLGILGEALHIRQLNNPHDVDCSEWGTQKLIEKFGAPKVLNVLAKRAYLITPEMLHLSPIFVGRMVYRKG